MIKDESTLSCPLFDVEAVRGCLEESNDDVPVICSNEGDVAYLIYCVLLSDHLLFSCRSTKMIPGIRVFPRKIHVLTL